MASKEFLTRVIQKHDIEENWNKATNFIPKQGEIIVYDIDAEHQHERLKIGDGATLVSNLPFYLADEIEYILLQLQTKVGVEIDNNILVFTNNTKN